MPGSSHRRAAIAFDIDGVFKYGREWAEAGLSSLRKASEAKIPYVFVTNGGGGLTEKVYGAHLKEKVLAAGGGSSGDIELPSAERMILSYTPWETQLVPGLVDKRVLLVGDPADKVRDVAATYGLKHAVHYSDYARAHPSINPFALARESGTSHTAVANTTVVKTAAQPASKENAEEPFAAILVMCDPYEWYEALQISIDVLCSPTPLSLEFDPNAAPMPIHFSNPDFLSKFEHPYPRFAQVRANVRAARVRRAACVRAACVQPVCSLRSACCIWAARMQWSSVRPAAHPKRCVRCSVHTQAVHTRSSERGLPCTLLRRAPSRWLSWRCTRRGCERCGCRRRALASGSARRSASGASPPPRPPRPTPSRASTPSSQPPRPTLAGKPTPGTYRFVEERLRSLAPDDGAPVTAETQWCFYMVGDNPTSDMEGVRRANIHHMGSTTQWRGVLVRTGVYKEGDETNGAHVVVDGIEQAVEWILEQESGAQPPPAKKPRA